MSAGSRDHRVCGEIALVRGARPSRVSSVLSYEITIDGAAVRSSNFHESPVRMHQVPREIDSPFPRPTIHPLASANLPSAGSRLRGASHYFAVTSERHRVPCSLSKHGFSWPSACLLIVPARFC